MIQLNNTYSRPAEAVGTYAQVRSNTYEEADISYLENAIYYFIKYAFIKQERGGCRLVVTHQERILHDGFYSSIKGAKIAFAKRYGYRLWQKGIRPIWTPLSNKPSQHH